MLGNLPSEEQVVEFPRIRLPLRRNRQLGRIQSPPVALLNEEPAADLPEFEPPLSVADLGGEKAHPRLFPERLDRFRREFRGDDHLEKRFGDR